MSTTVRLPQLGPQQEAVGVVQQREVASK